MTPANEQVLRLQRAHGRAEVGVSFRDGRVRLDRLYQQGCAKAFLPRVAGGGVEVVLVNTAGGVTGGDLLAYKLDAGPSARLVATTQAAERVYRTISGAARVEMQLRAAPGASLEWLPRETMLFDGGQISRRLDADLAGDAHLVALETVVFGRAASGEAVSCGSLSDTWRIRRDGRLLHVEAVRLEGDLDRAMKGPAALRGARALATLVHAAPDAEDRLDGARDMLADAAKGVVVAGASAKPGVLMVRFLAPDLAPLRTALARFLIRFRAASLPSVWNL